MQAPPLALAEEITIRIRHLELGEVENAQIHRCHRNIGSLAGSQIATQIFRLNFENAANLVPILRPLISPNNTINVNPGNNSLVITDYADNLQRLARIIAALDVANATDVEVINLQHALAIDLAPVVQRLVDSSGGPVTGAPAAQQGQTDTSFRTTVIAEPRSNSLIVRAANPARLNLVRSVVRRLDVPGSGGSAGKQGQQAPFGLRARDFDPGLAGPVVGRELADHLDDPGAPRY